MMRAMEDVYDHTTCNYSRVIIVVAQSRPRAFILKPGTTGLDSGFSMSITAIACLSFSLTFLSNIAHLMGWFKANQMGMGYYSLFQTDRLMLLKNLSSSS